MKNIYLFESEILIWPTSKSNEEGQGRASEARPVFNDQKLIYHWENGKKNYCIFNIIF